MSTDIADFALSRRAFVKMLGAGLLVSVEVGPALGQQRRKRRDTSSGAQNIAARLHIGRDGKITVMTGKVEMGQGARAELSQAAAEELGVTVEQIEMVMGDTALVPNDGITAGSRTTPSTVPAVRQGAAAARQLLVQLAARRWQVEPEALSVRNGKVVGAGERTLDYTDLVADEESAKRFKQAIPANVSVTAVQQWKAMGTSALRPNARDLITGAHRYPSDVVRPGMWYGKVLRPPSYGATLLEIDLGPAEAMSEVAAVRDGDFVGVAAPTTHRARQALDAIAATASWKPAAHPSSEEVFDYLRSRARGRVPDNPFAEQLSAADKVLKQTYLVPYVQHVPMETRAAVAEWSDGKLTVWAGTQNPFGYRGELARAFKLSEDEVRVIVPDFGCGFGGKHTGETGVEAARIARVAGRPIAVHWTREEEFTWAYSRPAAVIDMEASLDARGNLSSWHFINVNSGQSGVDTPYRTGKSHCRYVASETPIRQGSYRALAATANNFARECFMDELAAAAGADPLDFRLAHLVEPRLRAVLEEAARRFGWRERVKQRQPDVGVGLACGTEKASFVAACVEIAIDRAQDEIVVRRVCEVFECGAIVNPDNLRRQVAGCILMGLGPALHEELQFRNGKLRNASFQRYRVPRFSDVPELDIHLLPRPDLDSVGGGETPIIAIAPAIGNALYNATGVRVRSMPIRPPAVTKA